MPIPTTIKMIAKAFILLPLVGANADWWHPRPNLSWQISLNESIAPFDNVAAIDGDLFDTDAATWAALRKSGRKSICYFSAGSYEDWREDKDKFRKEDIGTPLEEPWEGESWLNTNSEHVRDIMRARMDMAAKKGCDAIDPDNIDVYGNGGGGFNLTQKDAINYVKFLSGEGHKRGMAVGLKNSGEIVKQVLDMVDFQVNEECVAQDGCKDFQPFIKANKPVFGIEYVEGTPSQAEIDDICNDDTRKDMSTLIKHLDLKRWFIACPGQTNQKASAFRA